MVLLSGNLRSRAEEIKLDDLRYESVDQIWTRETKTLYRNIYRCLWRGPVFGDMSPLTAVIAQAVEVLMPPRTRS